MKKTCPSCEDVLFGYTFREALDHLMMCCTDDGYYVMGLQPEMADDLYMQFTGEEPPMMNEIGRMKFYLSEATEA